jgi:ABC-type glycerol-3-phosphate transport system substrate-binding protein
MWLFYGTKLGDQQLRFPAAIAAPPLDGKPLTANAFQLRGLAISAKTPQPEACWAWLKFMTSYLAGLGWGIPARTSVAMSEDFAPQAPSGATEVYRAYRTALERTSAAESDRSTLGQSQLDYYWFFQAIDHALGGQDLEREVATAQTITEQYLACVRAGTPEGTCATQVEPDYKGKMQ